MQSKSGEKLQAAKRMLCWRAVKSRAFCTWPLSLMIVLSGGGGLTQAIAAEVPQVRLQMEDVPTGGRIEDGKRIGEGRISYHNNHTGFQVWSGAMTSSDRPEYYVITGISNNRHKIRVRLKGKGWMPDHKTGKGIILYTGDDSAGFYVVSDGEQYIPPDAYEFRVNGVALIP